MPSTRPPRFMWGVFAFIGAASMMVAVVMVVLAVRQGAEISAYEHARPCLAGAGTDADCLQPVVGSVTGVMESPASGRIPADYALEVQTASRAVHITFTADSPMLAYAVDGNPVVVTMWRGLPVAVMTDGRSEVTAWVPKTRFAEDVGNSAKAGGFGVFFFLGGLAIRRNGRVATPTQLAPVTAAVLLALGLGSFVVAIGGFVLGGKPSRLIPAAAAICGALLVVVGLAVWLGIYAVRRNRSLRALAPAGPASGLPASDLSASLSSAFNPPGLHAPELSETGVAEPSGTDAADDASVPAPPRLPGTPRVRRQSRPAVPLWMRLHPAVWIPRLRSSAAAWAVVLLTVGVLFGVLLTSIDGPPARAFRHAPTCAGETNLATCVGDFTAVINGIRTPAVSGDNYADVSYVTADGVINTWATFDGSSSALASAAAADERQQTLLTIKVWRGSIVGADLGGTWHWAQGDPPGDAIPAIFLAVCFGLLLPLVRVRAHRLARRARATDRSLILEDAGQAVVGAGAIVLLAAGFWPAAVLVLAVLVWLALSARRARKAAATAWR